MILGASNNEDTNPQSSTSDNNLMIKDDLGNQSDRLLNLSMEQVANTTLSPNDDSNPIAPNQESRSLEMDLFGDDDNEILQLINEESLWSTTKSTTKLTTNESNEAESVLLNIKNYASESNENSSEQSVKNAETEESTDVKNSQVETVDVTEMLPDAPEFSMDELPIFSKETADHPDENGSTEAKDGQEKIKSTHLDNSLNFTKDDLFELPDLFDLPDLDLDTPSIQNLENEKNEKDNETNNSVKSVESSDKGEKGSSSSSETSSGRKISLRQRNAIQLHPFTIEHVQFRNLISRSALKGKIADTQLADIPLDDEFLASQYVPPEEKTVVPSTRHRTQRTSAPSKSAKRKQTQRPVLPEGQTLPDLNTEDLERYGLDKLILPPVREKAKRKENKVITFDKKKGSRRKRPSARKPLRFTTPLNKDIFAFDANPQSNFNLTSSSSSDGTSRQSTVGVSHTISDTNTVDEETTNGLEIPNTDIFDFDYDASYSPNTSNTVSDNDNYNNEDDDDDETDELQLNFSRRLRNKRHLGLDSSDDDDDDDDDSTQQRRKGRKLTEKELDEIFQFPKGVLKSSDTVERLPRKINDDQDPVPVVADEFEFRENKRQRIKLKDMIKKKKLLKSVLPASFIKIYEKELLEEDENRKSEKQGSKPAIVENNANKKPKASTRDIDTFASFLGSQSDEEESSDDMQDVYPTTMDDYVIRLDTQLTETPNTNYVKSNELYIPPRHLFTSRRNIFTAKDVNQNKDSRKNDTRTDSTSLHIIQPSTNIDMNNTLSKPNIIQTNNNKSHTNNQPRITSTISLKKRNISKGNLDEESIEDNRIRGAGYRVPSGNSGRHKNRQARSKTSVKRRTPKSSIAIKKPVNIAPTFVQPIPIRDNPTPQRRRKRPKRCKDDIYVHAPVSSRIWSDKSGQLPDTNTRMFFKVPDFSSRKAFDDIYVGTQHTARYDSAPLKDSDSSNLTRNAKNPARIKEYIFDIQHSLHVVHSLQSVAKRIKHLYDHDLRRIKGLKDTVYLHHQLLAPLLSATPNLKSAYSRHKDTYAELNLFDKHLLWTNITIEESRIIDYMFFKVSRDLLQACSNAKESDTELPHHDHFYTFVSICLTQWIPCHTYENRIQLTELFMIHIRSLAWQIPRLVEEYSHKLLPWRSIVKLLIYILDWSCRLHHLGVHPIDWSVTECTQIMMDILVYIGYDSIRSKSTTREYLVEAWVCLIQIITVSSKESGYYFYEQVFIDQLIDSIKRKSRASDSYEFEKRKTTRLWAESLNYILDAYMML